MSDSRLISQTAKFAELIQAANYSMFMRYVKSDKSRVYVVRGFYQILPHDGPDEERPVACWGVDRLEVMSDQRPPRQLFPNWRPYPDEQRGIQPLSYFKDDGFFSILPAHPVTGVCRAKVAGYKDGCAGPAFFPAGYHLHEHMFDKDYFTKYSISSRVANEGDIKPW